SGSCRGGWRSDGVFCLWPRAVPRGPAGAASRLPPPPRPHRCRRPSACPAGVRPSLPRGALGAGCEGRLASHVYVRLAEGAGGNVGTEMVVRSAPDGYTLLMVIGANAISATLYAKLNVNFIRDIAPVASVMRTWFVMEVHPSVPANTVPEFIAHAQANPGKI